MSGAARGFELAVVYCGTCGEAAEGLPGSFTVRGLPEGWVSVRVAKYRRLSTDAEGEPLDDYHQRTLYYCAEAHLPAELLPSDDETGGE